MDNENDTVNIEDYTEAICNLAVESWKIGSVFDRMLKRLDAGEQHRYKNQLNYFQKKVQESLELVGLRVVNVEGHPFDPGMAASPLNIDEFEQGDELVVDQMLDPIILNEDGLVRTGTVTLKKARQ